MGGAVILACTLRAQDCFSRPRGLERSMAERTWTREGITLVRWINWRVASFIVSVTLGFLMRIKVTGRERVPESGGALLVSNHTTFFDFLLCLWGVYRPVHGIGSEQVFRIPVAGFLLKNLNGIPFSKGAKDRAAVGALARAYRNGGIIAMFPEGLRSWTGRPLPIKRGTGRLVKSLGCPVIYCKVYTGFLQHPRWATWPRMVPWRMEYFAPESFDADATPDDINAAIARGIAIDPDAVEVPPGSWGFRLAEGLPIYLWGCPSCFALEGLCVPKHDRDTVVCSGCKAVWRLDIGCRLTAETDGVSGFSVAEAHDALIEHFTVNDALSCEMMRVSTIQRGRLRKDELAAGACRLGDEALEVVADGEVIWSLRYDKMSAVLLQVRNKLQVRSAGQNYQLDPEGHSTLLWHHFLQMRAIAVSPECAVG